MPNNYATPMVMQSIDVTELVNPALFYPINAAGTEGAIAIVRFVNISDIDVFIGIGSEDAHIFVPSTTKVTFPITIELQKNAQPTNNEFLIKAGTIFYAIGDGALGNGNVYVTGWLRSES